MRIPSFMALGILALASLTAQAQVPLKIITTDQAGGGMDALIRPVAEKLAVALGRPVLVDNKPGAQGRIGGQAVVNSLPDGNTVLITVQAGIVINPHVYPWPYNSLADLLPVSDLGRGSLVLLTPASTPAANIKELAAWIKAQPKGKVNYGTGNATTISTQPTAAHPLPAGEGRGEGESQPATGSPKQPRRSAAAELLQSTKKRQNLPTPEEPAWA